MTTIFQNILEQIPEALIFADAEGIIQIWNKSAERIFGFTAEETLGRSLDMIIPEKFRKAHWVGFHKAIAEGHTAHSGEVRTTRSLHKTGEPLYVSLSFEIIHDESGKTIGSVAVGRDVTKEHLSQKNAKEYKREGI